MSPSMEVCMKVKIVPSDELSAKTLAPKDYIPGAFYNPEVLQALQVRERSSIPVEEDWPAYDVYLKGGRVHQLRVRRLGVVGIAIRIGWSLEAISCWTHYVFLRSHPEEYHEVAYKGVWESRLTVEQLMDAISWRARGGAK